MRVAWRGSLHARRISEVFIVHYRGHIYKYSSPEPLWRMLLVAGRTFKSELSTLICHLASETL